jgi:hypothetical protein
MRTTLGFLLAGLLLLVPSAQARTGWHLTKTVTYNGEQFTAHGKLCHASRFGDWDWKGTIWVRGESYRYHWIEPIDSDGHYHHLRLVSVGGSAIYRYPRSLRGQLIASIRQQFNRGRVIWLDGTGAADRVEYRHIFGDDSFPFRPLHGC